jgi:hypothetical protein
VWTSIPIFHTALLITQSPPRSFTIAHNLYAAFSTKSVESAPNPCFFSTPIMILYAVSPHFLLVFSPPFAATPGTQGTRNQRPLLSLGGECVARVHTYPQSFHVIHTTAALIHIIYVERLRERPPEGGLRIRAPVLQDTRLLFFFIALALLFIQVKGVDEIAEQRQVLITCLRLRGLRR